MADLREDGDFEFEEEEAVDAEYVEPEPPAEEEPQEPEPEVEEPEAQEATQSRRDPPVTAPPPTQALDLYNRKLNNLQDLWNRHAGLIQQLVPKHVELGRLFVVAVGAVSRSPELMKCTERSILRSMIIGSQLGLDVSGVGGMGYLVPFKNNRTGDMEAAFIPGYRGLIDLATRSGKIIAMWSREVYENDDFEYEDGLDYKLKHIPLRNLAATRGSLIGAWSVAQFHTGLRRPEVMTLADMAAVMRSSKAADKGPWKTHPAQMFRKSVIRRHCKTLPWSSEDLNYAMHVEDKAEQGDPIIIEQLELTDGGQGPTGAPATIPVVEERPAGTTTKATEVLAKLAAARAAGAAAAKRGRGRPAGSTNKPKEAV